MRKNLEPLKPQHPDYGFWQACAQTHCNTPLVWDATNRFLMKKFSLTARDSRALLENDSGYVLADALIRVDERRPSSAKDVQKRLKTAFARNSEALGTEITRSLSMPRSKSGMHPERYRQMRSLYSLIVKTQADYLLAPPHRSHTELPESAYDDEAACASIITYWQGADTFPEESAEELLAIKEKLERDVNEYRNRAHKNPAPYDASDFLSHVRVINDQKNTPSLTPL
jgi:hypothetical protein